MDHAARLRRAYRAGQRDVAKDGRRFMRDSSERWGEANVARGQDSATAAEQAERTVAAYTG